MTDSHSMYFAHNDEPSEIMEDLMFVGGTDLFPDLIQVKKFIEFQGETEAHWDYYKITIERLPK